MNPFRKGVLHSFGTGAAASLLGLGAIAIAASLYFIYDDSHSNSPVFDKRHTETLGLKFADIEGPSEAHPPPESGVATASISGSPNQTGSLSGRVGMHDASPPTDNVLRHVIVRGDSLLRIAESLALPEADLIALLTSNRAARALRQLQAGQRLDFRVQQDKLQQVTLVQDDTTLVTFSRRQDRDEFVLTFRKPGLRALVATGVPSRPTKVPPHNRPVKIPVAPVLAARVPHKDTAATTPDGDRTPGKALSEPPDAGLATDLAVAQPQKPGNRVTHRPSAAAAARSASSNAARELRKLIKVARGDSLYNIFRRDGYSLATLQAILASGRAANQLKRLRPGQQIELHLDEKRKVAELVYRPSETVAVRFVRDGSVFSSKIDERKYERRFATAAIRIQSSLFAAAAAAGLPDAVTAQLVEIFGWDVDFALDIRSGAEFTLVYEQLFLDGQFAKTGAVMAASFVNRGKTFKAVRYKVDGRADYFTPQGARLRRAFIRTPVRFARISSRFTTRRRHPILHSIRAHKGVDYAAPRGTPIRATGDGRIVHLGRKGGYGKAVIIQHGGVYTTLYAHLSRYGKKLRRGSRVRQGQIIGYVGSSGLATGPHLHYEFRVRGVHRNPLTVPLPRAGGLDKAERSRFLVEAKTILRRLDAASRTTLAQADRT